MVMDIFWLLYGLTVIPVAGVILSVVMLIKDFRGYRKTVLKKSLITALIALLLLGISLLPCYSEGYVGFIIVGLPLTILGPDSGFRWDWWMIETVLVWLNWFGICCFFTIGVKLLCGKENK